MFKPLLRTLPSLSGNFTIACKLKEFIKEDNNDYSTYIRLANIYPLQNFLSKKDIELNLLNGKYEYDISKYHYYYSNFFYKENFNYDKKNYAMLDLNSLYNNTNDTRNKDYEFGCKRINYSQHGSQFNFYAPFYLDDVNDLPEYFCIHIRLNDTIEKRIKIYINKDNKRNYLKNYLKRYYKQIDDKVIFCLPESLQATYFGIDIKKGGLVQYKDNVIGNLYNNQTTINNFDWTICQGFERNNLIMTQILPLSFSFNLNDIFNEYDKEFFKGAKLNIYGFYYTKNDIKYDLYDFDINYTNIYQRYNKYNENTGKYDFVSGKDSLDNNINIMNIGFPALNESKYVKYAFTNKITPKYCKFKLLYSSDEDPYITNINFAYSFIQYPNQKYGYFPTMFKGIYPKAIIYNNDFKLPIGTDLDTYYRTSKYSGNKVIINTTNIDKYIKLMSNYYSSWYNLKEYEDNNLIYNLCKDDSNWSIVKYDYSYYHGILYNLNFLKKYEIDKFGVFLDIKMNYVTKNELENNLIKARYILSKTDESPNVINQYNDSYNMKLYDTSTSKVYYNKLFDIFNNVNNYISKNQKYIFENQNMITDIKGKYIEETNYIEENTFYKLYDIINKFSEYINDNTIIERFKSLQVFGYLLLDGLNNINYFENYEDAYKEVHKRFMLTNKVYGTAEYLPAYSWLESLLYYSTAANKEKKLVSTIYENIDYNEDVFGKLVFFLKTAFIHKNDIANILIEYDKFNLFNFINQLDSYIYEPIGNTNGLDIDNYFIKNKNLDSLNIYVDPYNLKNYINQYNKKYKTNISSTFAKTEYFYVKFLNKNHIEEYIRALNKDEYGNTTFNLVVKDKIKNNIVNVYSNVLDYLYVKERCWIIDTNIMYAIDQYVSLYDYLKKYDYKTIAYIHSLYDKENILNWLLQNISDTRTNNDNFIFNFNGTNIELNLCFKKQMILLNDDLRKILKDNNFLYLYIKDTQKLENNNVWPILQESDTYNHLIENSNNYYEYKDIYEYLIPLFNDTYVNDNDCENIYNMLASNKINDKNQYVISNSKYFKEIDVDNEILNICSNDDKFIDTWLSNICSYTTYNNITNKYEKVLTVSSLEFEKEWNTYCNENKIYFEDLTDIQNNYDVLINNIIDLYYHKLNENELIAKQIYYIKNSLLIKPADRSKINDIFNIHTLIQNENELKTYILYYLLDNNSYSYIFDNSDILAIHNIIYQQNNIYNWYNNVSQYDILSPNDKNSIDKIINKYLIVFSYEEWKILFKLKNISDTDRNVINEIINDYQNEYVNKWNYLVFKNSLNNEDRNTIDYYENKKYIEYKNYVSYILDFIKNNSNSNLYYHLIKNKGIKLYSIKKSFDIVFNKLSSFDNITYDSDNKIYLYTDDNGINYAFYWISLNIDNTNNSFNMLNDYNLSVSFNSINGISILSDNFNKYFNKVFYLIEPFLNINIFNELTKNINSIIYPYESEININYVQSLLNDNEYNKYSMLQESSNELLYNEIIKIAESKKIKLLRYFNYITPYLKKTYIIEDSWKLKFMEKDNIYKSVRKFNILEKNNINIYKYDGVNLYSGIYDNKTYQFTSSELIKQCEYKHFNDNVLFNLPEEIIIKDKKVYSKEELETIKETDDEIQNKKIKILLKYFNKKGMDYRNIILFLFNKYDSNMIIERVNKNNTISKKLYTISYKFNLL